MSVKGMWKQLLPLAVGLGLQQVNIEELGLLIPIRVAYAAVQIAVLATFGIVYTRVKKSEDKTVVHVPAETQFGQEIKPATSMPTCEYDMSQLMKLVQQTAIQGLMTSLMHFQWGYLFPLAIQVVMGPISALDQPIVQIYVFGREAVGDLKRPFPAPSPFGLPQTPAQPPTQKELKREAKEAKKEAAKAESSKKDGAKDD